MTVDVRVLDRYTGVLVPHCRKRCFTKAVRSSYTQWMRLSYMVPTDENGGGCQEKIALTRAPRRLASEKATSSAVSASSVPS